MLPLFFLVCFGLIIPTLTTSCVMLNSSPVACKKNETGTNACLELITCNTTNTGVNSPCNTETCLAPFGSYCCPVGAPLPYFVSGVCQCTPTPSSCNILNSSPVTCKSINPGTSACEELITCNTTNTGVNSPCNTETCLAPFGSYCCPVGAPLPYFVSGVCQCTPSTSTPTSTPTPSSCKILNSSPVTCKKNETGTSACKELVTCNTTNTGVNSPCNTETCLAPYGSYCCPVGAPLPYFVSGVCQCTPSTSTPTPSSCSILNSSPVTCESISPGTSACEELITCNTTNTGVNSPCNTDTCLAPFGSYCCPVGAPLPYFVSGVCQCTSSTPTSTPTPTPSTCTILNSSPVICKSISPGTSACKELITCNTTNTGENSPCNTKTCLSPYGSYCCPVGAPLPYFVSGVCQCSDGLVLSPLFSLVTLVLLLFFNLIEK